MFSKKTCGLPSARPIFRTVEDAGPYDHNIKSATKSVGDVVLGDPFTLNYQPHPI